MVAPAEYLRSRGFPQTVSTFQAESQARPRLVTPPHTDQLQQDFLVAFECGEHNAFFDLWNQNVPQATREQDTACQSLEFSLSVYFAIYPIRTGTGDREVSLHQFTEYLDTRREVLAHNDELATYCALPYVPDLTRHPSFRKLFTDSWTSELKARLLQLLRLSLSGATPTPQLLSIYLTSKTNHSKDSVAEANHYHTQLIECQSQYAQRLTEVQNSYHTLVGIAMELLDALESAIAGRLITPEYIQSICSRLFGNSLSLSLSQPAAAAATDHQRPATATDILRQSVIYLKESMQEPFALSTTYTSTPLPKALSPPDAHPHASHPHTLTPSHLTPSQAAAVKVGEVDFGRVKADLLSANNMTKALLLQALRWRLTRSLTADQRQSIMESYIINDVLGCSAGGSERPLISSLLSSSSALVQEHSSRLLNSFSSLSSGRSYLSHSPPLITALCEFLTKGEGGGGGGGGGGKSQDRETNAIRNALGAIQKLSLRRHLQTIMIEGGLTQWIVCVLSEREGLCDYILRYSLALWMNLCLRNAGKRVCVDVASTALGCLGELLEHEDQEICSYVNGILYSLTSVPELKAEAKSMGMSDMLKSALQASPPELQSQLNYIIAQLNADTVPVAEDSGDEGEEDEEEEEPDMLEGDEDESPITTGGLVGESLLINYLKNSCKKSNEQEFVVPKVASSQELLGTPLTRPVTPHGRGQSVEKDTVGSNSRSSTAAK